MKFSVEGPLPKTRGMREHRTPFTEDGLSIAAQYARSRSDTEPDIHCFEVRSDRGDAVGLLGLKLSDETFLGERVAYSSVDYIFVRPAFRQLGLSTLLMERALWVVCLWLEMLKSESDNLAFESWATFESTLGRRVVTHWDLALLVFCRSHGIGFWAVSLAELDALEG